MQTPTRSQCFSLTLVTPPSIARLRHYKAHRRRMRRSHATPPQPSPIAQKIVVRSGCGEDIRQIFTNFDRSAQLGFLVSDRLQPTATIVGDLRRLYNLRRY